MVEPQRVGEAAEGVCAEDEDDPMLQPMRI